jgi:hypothetical protein
MYIKKDLFGYELVTYNDNIPKVKQSYNNLDRDYIADSKFRAKRQVIEYAMNNTFNWFVTITFDKNKIDRYDSVLLEKKVRNWLRNNLRDYGNKSSYLMVPEFHKDKAIHFHLLMNMENEKLRYLYNHKDWNKPVYKDRLLFNKFGRNQWVPIDSYTEPIGLYLSKYISKLPDKMNTQYYFASQDLKKSEKIDIDLDLEKLNLTPVATTRFCTIYRFDKEMFDKLKNI